MKNRRIRIFVRRGSPCGVIPFLDFDLWRQTVGTLYPQLCADQVETVGSFVMVCRYACVFGIIVNLIFDIFFLLLKFSHFGA